MQSGLGPFSKISIHSSRVRMGPILLPKDIDVEDSLREEEEEDNDGRMVVKEAVDVRG